MKDRRDFFRNVFGLGAGVLSADSSVAQRAGHNSVSEGPRNKRADVANAGPPVIVQSPDLKELPFTIDNGVKVFNLVAEPVKQRIAPDKTIDVWGFNGSAPGPTIQVT